MKNQQTNSKFIDVYNSKLHNNSIDKDQVTLKINEQLLRKFTGSQEDITRLVSTDKFGVIRAIQSRYGSIEDRLYSMHLRNLDKQSNFEIGAEELVMFTESSNTSHIEYTNIQWDEKLRLLMLARDVAIAALFYEIDNSAVKCNIQDLNKLVFGNKYEYNSIVDILDTIGINIIYLVIFELLGNKLYWPFESSGVNIIIAGINRAKSTQLGYLLKNKLSERQKKCMQLLIYAGNSDGTDIPSKLTVDNMIIFKKQMDNRFIQYRGDL